MKHFRLKSVFAAFMAVAMVMGLAACGGTKNAEDDVQDSEIVASGTEVTEAQYLDLLDEMNEYVEQARRDAVNPGDAQPTDMPEGELPEGEAPADMPEGGEPNGEAPNGEAPEDMPEGGAPDGAAPQGGDNSGMEAFFTNMLSIAAPEGYEDIHVSAHAVSNAMLEYLDASANLATETDETAKAELEETKTTALNTATLAQVDVLQALSAMNTASGTDSAE